MADRRPLVTFGGYNRELPTTDVLDAGLQIKARSARFVETTAGGLTLYLQYTRMIGGGPAFTINNGLFNIVEFGGNQTATEGVLTLRAPTGQGSGVGVNFQSDIGGTTRTGQFQMDNAGNMVFRQGTGSMFFDFYNAVNFRNSAFTNIMDVNSVGILSTLGAVAPKANDGAALGIAGRAWADAFFAVGAVINFGASDVTLTHSADALTVAGGEFNVVPQVYSAGWNGNNGAATKNDIYDKIETITGGGGSGHPWYWLPPAAADFASPYSHDANNVTITDDPDVGLVTRNPIVTVGTNRTRIITKAVPNTDFVLTARLNISNLILAGGPVTGLVLYESATGKFIMFGLYGDTNVLSQAVYRYTNLSTFLSTARVASSAGAAYASGFYRIERVGTNLNFYLSTDGKNFALFSTSTVAAGFTTAPDRIGFGFVNSSAGLADAAISCERWVQSW